MQFKSNNNCLLSSKIMRPERGKYCTHVITGAWVVAASTKFLDFLKESYILWNIHLVLFWFRTFDTRLLHSPSLLAVGLPVGYETLPPTGWSWSMDLWFADLNIDWETYRLHWIMGSRDHAVGISTVFQMPLTVPLYSPNDRFCLPLGLC